MPRAWTTRSSPWQACVTATKCARPKLSRSLRMRGGPPAPLNVSGRCVKELLAKTPICAAPLRKRPTSAKARSLKNRPSDDSRGGAEDDEADHRLGWEVIQKLPF